MTTVYFMKATEKRSSDNNVSSPYGGVGFAEVWISRNIVYEWTLKHLKLCPLIQKIIFVIGDDTVF